MKTINENRSNMLEILFKGRNKAYGAYVIRSAYNLTIVKSLLATSTLLLIIIVASGIYHKLNDAIEVPQTFTDGGFISTIYDNTPKDTKLEQKVNTSKAGPKTYSTPAIKDNAVNLEDKKIEVVNGGSSDGKIGSTGVGTDTSGKNDIIVVRPETKKEEEKVETFVPEMPEFVGGTKALMEFLGNNIRYPELAKEVGKEGMVFIRFVVDKEGAVSKVEVLKGIGYGCDQEAMRVVGKMPKWKPGKNADGKPVNVMFNLPIKFVLN